MGKQEGRNSTKESMEERAGDRGAMDCTEDCKRAGKQWLHCLKEMKQWLTRGNEETKVRGGTGFSEHKVKVTGHLVSERVNPGLKVKWGGEAELTGLTGHQYGS